MFAKKKKKLKYFINYLTDVFLLERVFFHYYSIFINQALHVFCLRIKNVMSVFDFFSSYFKEVLK